METDKHYFKVGMFILVTAFAIALFTIWLVGDYDKSKYGQYGIQFSESVSGLDVGGSVKFRGVQVGKVASITINQQDTQLIDVKISILKTTPVKTDTRASLKLQGITGGVFIELSSGSQEAQKLVGSNNDNGELPMLKAETSTLATLMDILPQILQKISSIADQADKMFNDKNIAAFSATMVNLQNATHDISELTHNIRNDPSKLVFPPKEKGIPAP